MKKLLIGTAGFNNSYWEGIFYPDDLARSKWFAYYCTQFPMFEINASFYKFPTEKSMKTWYGKSPENFLFVAKAPRVITHFKKFNDCEREIGEFYEACQNGLQEKLYATLFQLPPSFSYTPERLELITSSLSPKVRNIVEFRNVSWWNPEVYEALASKNIIFCSVSFPNLPEDIIKTSPIGYARLHGNTKLFYSGYDNDNLAALYKEILSKDFKEMTVCFNNTASERGILDAIALQTLSNVK